ncbi:excisionase family DNA-binding protein [Nocardia puris]|nr:excisionase family DNA-binding protein [Nocardia puris]MBF6369898.1 excisionase family DNA-binding protein [Nocardia puris]
MPDQDIAAILSRLHSEATVSVSEFAQLVGVGRSTAYAAIAAGSIPAVRVGRRVRVPSAWVLRQLNG